MGATRPFPFPVNDTHFKEASPPRLSEILAEDAGQITGKERMEVERIFDGEPCWIFVSHPMTDQPTARFSQSAVSFTRRSASRSALTASGSAGTTIGWPQTQAVEKPPPGRRAARGIWIGHPSLMLRSADQRRSDPEIRSG